VGEARQAGTAGAHAHQQGVVDEPIGQDRHGGKVGLEAAGEQQHTIAAEPGGQGLLQWRKDQDVRTPMTGAVWDGGWVEARFGGL